MISRNTTPGRSIDPACTSTRGARRPEDTPLYRVLQRHLATFLERAQVNGGVPAFVERELRAHLSCGILANGFVRVHCDGCGHDRLVGYSCKGRGFCPSCGGRRMADTAAWLRDSVLVGVPVRQWVLTFPWWLRRAVAFDADLGSALLRTLVRVVHRRLGARTTGQYGAVTVVQRFGGALNLNPHFHTLIPEGVYRARGDGEVWFEPVPGPTRMDLQAALDTIVASTRRILERRNIRPSGTPTLQRLAEASRRQLQLLGPDPGAPVERTLGEMPGGFDRKMLSVERDGFTLNAAVFVEASDPDALEQLCRYIARPAVAQRRIRLLSGDRVALTLRHPWRDGTRELVFDPLDFIARLASLVPAPGTNLVRYHGVFAPAARLRPKIIQAASPDDARAISMGHDRPGARPAGLRQRLTWAALMARVFGTDVLQCPHCEGRMRVLAHIEEPSVVARILRHVGLPTIAPALHPARPPPEQFDWVA